jgi:hypothetical protein
MSTAIAVVEDRKEAEGRTRGHTWKPFVIPTLAQGEHVAKDAATGLEWTVRTAPERLRWEDGKAYCASLDLDGAGWRLPSRDELLTIMKVRDDPFDGGVEWYWTATPAVRERTAWAVGTDSWMNGNPIESRSLVRCTRGPR